MKSPIGRVMLTITEQLSRCGCGYRPEHAVAARTDRQVQERHQFFDIAISPCALSLGWLVVCCARPSIDRARIRSQTAPVTVAPRIDVLPEQIQRAGVDQVWPRRDFRRLPRRRGQGTTQ